MPGMSPEQYAAHQARVKSARTVDRGMTPKPRAAKGVPAGLRLPEWRVLKACMDVLETHPHIAFWWRQNTGGVKYGEQYVKFSFKGASDLMAVTTTGRFVAIECKATGKHATVEQRAFLDRVHAAGGVSACIDDAAALVEALKWQINFPRGTKPPAIPIARQLAIDTDAPDTQMKIVPHNERKG